LASFVQLLKDSPRNLDVCARMATPLIGGRETDRVHAPRDEVREVV